MSDESNDMVSVTILLSKQDLNKLTHMTSKLTYEDAVRDAAFEQITNYRSKIDPLGLKPFKVLSPIDE
jgi:hypothetical protein